MPDHLLTLVGLLTGLYLLILGWRLLAVTAPPPPTTSYDFTLYSGPVYNRHGREIRP